MPKFACRKAMLAICLVLSTTACFASQGHLVWEYKVLRVDAKMGSPEYYSISPSEAELNALGKEGWELVGTSIELGTAFRKMNAGMGVIDHTRDAMVPLVHPQSLILIFKRQVMPPAMKPSHVIIGKGG